jgi:hypothetical protein
MPLWRDNHAKEEVLKNLILQVLAIKCRSIYMEYWNGGSVLSKR